MCFVLCLASCKKKKDEEPTPTPVPVTPPVKMMTAKVKGINWEAANNAFSTSKSGGFYGFFGRTSQSNPHTMISFNFPYTVGTLTVGGGFGAVYKDSTDLYHYAQTGTLSITQLDTNSTFGLISRMKATFTFVTTSSITVTDGVVDYTKP